MIELNFVFCIDKDGGISKDNEIPWKFKEDNTYFKDIITKKNNNKRNIIICGKKTFHKMGFYKNNLTIVLTKKLEEIYDKEQVISFDSIDKLLQFLKTEDYGKIYICGGKKVYDEFYHICIDYPKTYYGIIHATIINKSYECDNFLPGHLINKVKKKIENFDGSFESGLLIENSSVELLFLKPFDTYDNYIKINNEDELKYLKLMKNILIAPEKNGRNGITKSLFGEMLKFKLNKFPMLTTKKLFFKGVFEELMFFIRGETDSTKLSNKNVKIWELNTTKQFIENRGLDYEEGDMGPMYGFQWRHFNAEYKGMNHNYKKEGYDQLKYVLNELKTNPESRRIIMTTFNPAQASKGVLYPCHGIGIVFNTQLDTYYNITNTEKPIYCLNIMQLQRSCDYFLGVPFNIASYALLVYMICEVLNNDEECKFRYKPGELTISLGDYHLYKNHYEEAQRQLLRTPNEFPNLYFNKKIYNIEEFELNDIDIVHYNFWPEIKTQMVQ
jgi:dihydrofolate reductase/thymidylate synthase